MSELMWLPEPCAPVPASSSATQQDSREPRVSMSIMASFKLFSLLENTSLKVLEA